VKQRRILGIDPGSRVTGYAVIDSDGNRSIHIESGCIRLSGDAEMSFRLGEIFQSISSIIQRCCPTELAIEDIFMSKNASSALKLGQARGAAICAAVTNGLNVSEYAPRAVKQAVVGTGGADKEQVRHMVKMLLQLDQELAADQSDALAVALAHAHSAGMESRLAALRARR
jgi:crossover junction endodeoxyribonuclease RuvC